MSTIPTRGSSFRRQDNAPSGVANVLSAPSRAGRFVALGAVGGLAWSSSLRGWMIQVANAESQSTFTWLGTIVLVLGPGATVGALLGWAEYLRRRGELDGRRRRLLVGSPALLMAALLDPTIFKLLITSGIGGGAIGVTAIGMAGGFALSRRGSRRARRAAGTFAVLLSLACGLMVAEAQPLTTPQGLWIALNVTSLLGVLCAACSIPHRPSPR